MRGSNVFPVLLLFLSTVSAQTVPPGWNTVKDTKGLCQIAVPPEWTSLGENTGAAVFRDSSNAIAVVTSQSGQAFKPLPNPLVRSLDIPKERMFENTPKRIFYQDRVSKGPESANAYSSSVPAKNGTCSCHLVLLPSIPEEVAKKIVMTLGPVAGDGPTPN
jgi:hypothetical protein